MSENRRLSSPFTRLHLVPKSGVSYSCYVKVANNSGGETSTLDAIGHNKSAWKIELSDDALRFKEMSGPGESVLLRDSIDELDLLDGPVITRMLRLKRAKVAMQLDSKGFQAIWAWVGQAQMLKKVLKQRLSWYLALAAIFIVGSLPIAADPDAGVDAVAFDLESALLGAALLVLGAASRLWPHRVLLLLDSAWFVALAGIGIRDIIVGSSSIYWSPLILLQLGLVYSGVLLWKRLRPESLG